MGCLRTHIDDIFDDYDAKVAVFGDWRLRWKTYTLGHYFHE
jgi:hypothetical protein